MNIDLLLEAERRGILPDNKKALLDEARRRGLVPGGSQGQPATPAREMGTGQAIYENVIGSGEIDTPGERFGAAVGDVVRSGASGVVQGATALLDLPGQALNAGASLVASGMERLGASPEFAQGIRDGIAVATPMGDGQVAANTANLVAPSAMAYQPQTAAGEYAQTAGEFLPGGALAKAPIAFGVVPGLVSEAFGQAAEGEQFPQNTPLIGGTDVEPWARAAGALLGPTIANAGMRLVTPNPTDPARIAASRKLEGEGVRLTAGQKTGNVALRNREEYLPRTQQILQDQGDEFTSAAMRRVGAEGRAEPEVLRATLKRLGDAFEDLASRNKITPDAELKTARDAALKAYADLTDAAPTQVLRDAANRIEAAIRSGRPISGRVFQDLRTRLGRAQTSSDSALREGATAMKNALEDAMERSIAATGNTDDIARYAQVRQQYRDLLAIERAATSAGQDTALGIINPRQLRGATVSQGRREYASGSRELAELSRAGNAVMSQVPNSGTPDRLRAMINALSAGPTTVAGGVLGHTLGGGNPAITAAATMAGLIAPAARNALTASSVGQRYLANQLAPGMVNTMSPETLAIIASLLGQREERPEQ